MPTHVSRLSFKDRGTSKDNLHNGPRLEGPGTSDRTEEELHGPFQRGASGRFGHGTLDLTTTPEEQPPLTLPRFVIVDQDTARHESHCVRVPQFHSRLDADQVEYRIANRQTQGIPGTQLCLWFMEYTEGSTPEQATHTSRYFAVLAANRAARSVAAKRDNKDREILNNVARSETRA